MTPYQELQHHWGNSVFFFPLKVTEHQRETHEWFWYEQMDSIDLPLALLSGLVIASQVLRSSLGDNTQVHVAAWAQVTEDPCSDGVSYQLLGLLQLEERATSMAGTSRGRWWFVQRSDFHSWSPQMLLLLHLIYNSCTWAPQRHTANYCDVIQPQLTVDCVTVFECVCVSLERFTLWGSGC